MPPRKPWIWATVGLPLIVGALTVLLGGAVQGDDPGAMGWLPILAGFAVLFGATAWLARRRGLSAGGALAMGALSVAALIGWTLLLLVLWLILLAVACGGGNCLD